jgi:hypothetical protein
MMKFKHTALEVPVRSAAAAIRDTTERIESAMCVASPTPAAWAIQRLARLGPPK